MPDHAGHKCHNSCSSASHLGVLQLVLPSSDAPRYARRAKVECVQFRCLPWRSCRRSRCSFGCNGAATCSDRGEPPAGGPRRANAGHRPCGSKTRTMAVRLQRGRPRAARLCPRRAIRVDADANRRAKRRIRGPSHRGGHSARATGPRAGQKDGKLALPQVRGRFGSASWHRDGHVRSSRGAIGCESARSPAASR